MKRFLTILIPVALAACQTLPAEPVADDVTEMRSVTADDKIPETDTLLGGPGDVNATDTADKSDVADADPKTDIVPPNFVEYYKSDLVLALITEPLKADDIALMGIVSGARAYCELRWEPGFVTFINAANRQGLDLGRVADDHGYYLGSSVRALVEAKYECSETDLIDLRAVNPY